MLKLVNFSGSFEVAIFLKKYSALVVSVSCTLLAEVNPVAGTQKPDSSGKPGISGADGSGIV